MAEPNDSIVRILEKLNLQYRYRCFNNSDVQLPYATYYIEHERFYGSDERTMLKESDITIDLFTAAKDFELEKCIENELIGEQFEKTEHFDYTDEVYCITYQIKVTSKNRR